MQYKTILYPAYSHFFGMWDRQLKAINDGLKANECFLQEVTFTTSLLIGKTKSFKFVTFCISNPKGICS